VIAINNNKSYSNKALFLFPRAAFYCVTILCVFFCAFECALAGAVSIDLKKTENYFYDRFYPDCNAGPKVTDNYDRAAESFEKKDIIKALFYLNNVLKYSQFSKEALNLYGVVLMYEGDYEGARELFRSSINRDPHYKWPYINLGIINYELEKWRELESVCGRYLSVDSGDFEANMGMGIAAFHLFCYEQAGEYFKKAHAVQKNARCRDMIKLLNDYRARLRAKSRRLH